MIPGINTMLKLNILTNDENIAKKNYKSRVSDVNENYLSIEVPIDEVTGRNGFFPLGTLILASFLGVDGAIYQFHSSVVGRIKEGLSFLTISFPKVDEIKRIQRRNYFRTPAALELSAKTLDSKRLHFLAKTLDIGGGGVAFHHNIEEQFMLGELLYCWVVLPFKNMVEHVQFIGRIVRVAPYKENKNLTSVSLMFTDIKEAERNKIIRYCLERQVDLRKKGSI